MTVIVGLTALLQLSLTGLAIGLVLWLIVSLGITIWRVNRTPVLLGCAGAILLPTIGILLALAAR